MIMDLNRLCKELLGLKEKLKCPICLDIVGECAELECSHRLCSNCFGNLRTSNQKVCPLCKAVITRRFVPYKDVFADKIAEFVSVVCRDIEGKEGSSIEQIVHQNKESQQVEKTKNKNLPSTSKESSNDTVLKVVPEKENVYKKIYNNKRKSGGRNDSINKSNKNSKIKLVPKNLDKETKNKQDEEKSKKSSPQEQKGHASQVSVSKEDAFDRLLKRSLGMETKNKPDEKKSKKSSPQEQKGHASQVSVSKEDAFDRLLKRSQEFLVNKKGSKQKYTRKKTDKDEEYQILDFHDNSNRNEVLNWLNDNRNKFDRLTQTQVCLEQRVDYEKDEIPTIDLTSVSQANRNRQIKVPVAPKRRGRARSLALENKLPREKSRLSDGSILGVENYTIEDNTEEFLIKKAEENVIIHIIEDEYLDKMEKDFRKKSAPPKEEQTTQSSTTGWERIEKITKTLRKKEKVPKKLNVSVQQTQITRGRRMLDKVLSERDIQKPPSPKKEDFKNTSGGTDESDEVVRKTTRHRSTRSNTRKSGGIENQSFDKGSIRATDADNEKDKDPHHIEIKAIIHKSADVNESGSMNVKEVVENSKEIIVPKPKSPNKLHDLKDFERFVKTNIEKVPDSSFNETISSQNSDKENMLNAANAPKQIVILNNILVKQPEIQQTTREINPYLLPTQKINVSDDTETCMDIDHDINWDKDARNDLAEQNESFHEFNDFDEGMNKLLKNLETYSENLNKNKLITKKQIENIQKCIEKLNEIHKIVEKSVPVVPERTHKNVQTEKNVVECAIQTVEENQAALNTLCKNCNKKIISKLNSSSSSCKTRSSSRRNSGKSAKVTQIDDFAGTLVLNFETQDIERQFKDKIEDMASSTKIKDVDIMEAENQTEVTTDQSDKVADESKIKNISISEQLEKEDDNILVCSMKSEGPENKGQNSMKRKLSDSDSEIVAVPKRRCNRFIRDDLSVEFGNSENPNNYANNKKSSFSSGLSPETNEEDDDEYLNKILKKYETGVEECNSSPPSNKENVDMELEDNFEDLLARLHKNVAPVSKAKEDTESQHSKTVSNDNNLLPHNQSLSKLDNDVQYKETENSDIIAETESMEPLPKKTKRRLNDVFVEEKSAEKPLNKENTIVTKSNKETFCDELEDSFDGVDFANINIEEAVNDVNNTKNCKENEDDLFSDDDIVETTPQKQVDVTEKKSQLFNITSNRSLFPALDEVDKEIIDNFDVNFVTLSPPPGFEDEKEATNPEDVTVINTEAPQMPVEEKPEARTPDILSAERTVRNTTPTNNLTGFASLDGSVQKLSHSTPLTQNNLTRHTLGISPIVQEKSLFEKAYSSNTLTSSAIRDTPKKKNLLTSLPNQKSILNYVRPSQDSTTNVAPKQKPCLACTRLSKVQTQSISLLTNKKLATYSAKFNDSVTHMIVTLDESKRIKDYTMKFVSAVASGIWVLGYEWVQECLKTNSIVPEEAYEALDDSGGTGPKTARLSRLKTPLFKGFKFYCVNPLYSTTVEEIEDVITKLGGITVKNLENLKENDGRIGLIITEGRSTQDFEIYERWLEKYKIVTVDIEWLSRSVGRYKVISVRPYIWCSDDLLDDIGYPSYLTEQSNSFLSLQD